MSIWIKLCENANCVFDIGANTGVFALVAKTMNKNAKVYAFEPVNRVYNKLCKNINLNKYEITAVNSAVSNSNGTAIIYDTPTEHILSVTVNKNLASPETTVVETEIKTVTLNSYIKENGITGIDLMKIDVETHEPEVLQGFSEYLSRFQPTFLIEILNDDVGAKVQKLVEGMNYLYFYIDEDKGLQQVKEIRRYKNYNYLLCKSEVAKQLQIEVNVSWA